jgi:hypothetical protein
MSNKTHRELAIENLWRGRNGIGMSHEERQCIIATAQVHAILYLADVTAQTQPECDHVTVEDGKEMRWWIYCPKCGVKL